MWGLSFLDLNFMVGGSALFTRNVYRRFVPSTSDLRESLVGRMAALIIVIGLLAASIG